MCQNNIINERNYKQNEVDFEVDFEFAADMGRERTQHLTYLEVAKRFKTKFCKLVYPWEGVSEIQFIQETV